MVLLSSEILTHLVEDYGPNEVLRRLSDPFWFQAFGRVLGFDWHSSGVTTTVCGAVKESLREPVARGGCLPLAEKGPPRGKPPRKSPASATTSARILALKRLAVFLP